MISIDCFVLPMFQYIRNISTRYIWQMKCSDRFSIGCRKKSVNELLIVIHNKNTAANKRKTENGKFIPYQWCDPVKISDRSHRGNVRTNTIECRLLYGFSSTRFRFLQIHVSLECKIDNGCKPSQNLYLGIIVRNFRPCV